MAPYPDAMVGGELYDRRVRRGGEEEVLRRRRLSEVVRSLLRGTSN